MYKYNQRNKYIMLQAKLNKVSKLLKQESEAMAFGQELLVQEKTHIIRL